jgi:glycosyltransferase involved in cell wall biosynthesis
MADDGPLISVVITCFNYARYVAGATDSALAQSYPNKEVIVVNDGSRDESLAVIARYADRVRIIDQPNLGAFAAYNHGFAACTGEIVLFLDADDLLEPNALSRIAEAWSNGCAKVQFDLTIIDAEGRDLGRKFCNFDAGYDESRVRQSFQRTGTYRWPVTVGNAYAHRFVSEVFPLRSGDYPDGILNTIAPVYGAVVTIPSALGRYRIHGGNLWSNTGSDFERLPQRIALRQQELRAMVAHAQKKRVVLPPGSALDHELPFINYRLMAKKLGLSYPEAERDSTLGLLSMARKVLCAERYPLKLGLAHAVWFGVLGSSPKIAARALIRVRFQRQTIAPTVKRALGRLLRRTSVASVASSASAERAPT